MDSILLAHVADTYEAVTGERDYDVAADEAARLLERSAELRAIAARFASGEATDAELRRVVTSVIGGRA